MSAGELRAPEGQGATWVELFFDLVFVFSVTQVVGMLHHGLDWATIGQATLVFWLVWWAWSQFTWGLNAADSTHPTVQLGTLTATGVAFIMTVALPDAFQERALWFAIPYVLVRIIGLGLGYWVTSVNPSQQANVRTFALLSLGGLATVLIGAVVGGTAQYIFWGITIVADILAGMISGQNEGWDLRPHHFGERHGLFVIIALGEILIIAAGGVSSDTWSGEMITIAALAVAITCGLWWSYFARAKFLIDKALAASQGTQQFAMARDVFSLIHFPMLCGVIAYAAALEEAVAHPGQPLSQSVQLTLAAGVVLFVGGMALAMWRAARHAALPRVIITLLAAATIAIVNGINPVSSLAIVFASLVIIALIEQRTISPLVKSESEHANI